MSKDQKFVSFVSGENTEKTTQNKDTNMTTPDTDRDIIVTSIYHFPNLYLADRR